MSWAGQRSAASHTVNDLDRWKADCPGKQTVQLFLGRLQQSYNSTLNSLTNWLCTFSGTRWATEDNALQAGKFIKDRIILNSNTWKRATWFEIEMRWIRWAKSLIFTLADELKGIFDEKGYFSSTMVEMETCAYCVKSAIHPKKRDIFFVKVWLYHRSSYFGEDGVPGPCLFHRSLDGVM